MSVKNENPSLFQLAFSESNENPMVFSMSKKNYPGISGLFFLSSVVKTHMFYDERGVP